MSESITAFIDGKKTDRECPKSANGYDCPVCGKRLEMGYGFAGGYGLGSYSYCDDHGFYDFYEDIR